MLDKQKKILQSAIDTLTKRYEVQIAEKKKEYDALYLKKAQILKAYNEKIRMLRTKGSEIGELIQRAKNEGAQDKGLLEILTKWEEANQKLFDANRILVEGGDDAEGDMSLLEVAKEEMNKARESEEVTRRVSGGVQDKAKEAAAKKKKAKEDEEEMRRYMEELKKKEEEI